MEENFWHQKWANKDIGFHQLDVHPLLVAHLSSLKLAPNARIFLPLCGKTLDIHWLLAQGFCVVGAELSQIAIEELFAELNLTPTIKSLGEITHCSAPNLDIFVGDIFSLTQDQLGLVDAIYDRAALVALPDSMRVSYTQHLTAITNSAPQLLITFEYDQSKLQGPPFSIDQAALTQLYHHHYALTLLTTQALASQFKGQVDATELVWHLSRKP